MTLGVLSDIHGNRTALEAVIADGRARGVERWWALGDLVAIGPDPADTLELLANIPAVLATRGNTELDDRTRLLGVHASPGRDDGDGITPHRPDEDLRVAFHGADAEVVLAGHTHQPTDRRIAGIRAGNGGSVSNPVTDDLRAGYVIVHADRHGYQIEHRRVSYDRDEFLRRVRDSGHPAHPYIASFQLGDQFRYPAQRPGAPVVAD